MSYDLYLSYSGRKTYKSCPKQYYFRYIKKDPSPFDVRTTMFGSAIGKIFEWFYTDMYWAKPNPTEFALSKIKDAIELTYAKEGYVKGTDPIYESGLYSDMNTYVPEGIEIIKKHKFLTPESRVEEDLTISYSLPGSSLTLKLGGRADFIHGKKDDLWIVDGKASKHRAKYVDSDQLIWYAAQHYLKYGVAPHQLGFVFWCFPKNPVSWIEYDSDTVRGLLKDTFEIAQKILDKDFEAKPHGSCYRCQYKEVCQEGKKYLHQRKLETVGVVDPENSIFDIEKV